MRLTILLVGLLTILIGCSYPVILVGPRPKGSPPRIEFWIKPDTSAEQRVQDSIHCKGNKFGLPIEIQANLKAAMLPGEEDTKFARRRLFNNWQRCMLGKGYQYIGECYPNEISRSRPACGGP